MAKNFATIYADTGDSSAQVQSFFVKEESVRGTFAVPDDADFLFTLSGGSTNFSQPKFSSPHRSGRSHLSVIREKTETTFSLPTYFNIDSSLGAASSAEVDAAVRVLNKSLFGTEDLAAGAQYSPGTPSTTFTMLENGDKFAKQSVGCFVEDAEASLPGDGQAQMTYNGFGKTSVMIGVGKLTGISHDGGNDVVVETGEGKRFRVGGQVMLIEADGTTRSADTASNTPRAITAIVGDTITLDGAVLADADASGADIYLAYYEPLSPTGINDPQVGLQGRITIAGYSTLDCVRNATISLANNHELKDNCFGAEGLAGALFVPGGRLTIGVSLEINMNAEMVELLQDIRDSDAGLDVEIILGDESGRHLDIDMDRVIMSLPAVEVPESGSIPVTLESAAVVQSAIDAQDEISWHYK